MKKRKKILSDRSGMTLVEILTAFFILMLASKAVVSCISGYSRVIEKSRELSAAGTEVERLTGGGRAADRCDPGRGAGRAFTGYVL